MERYFLIAFFVFAANAQPLTSDEEALYKRLQARKDEFNVKVQPKISTSDGDIEMVVANGKHIGYKIGDEDVVNLDLIPSQMREYTQATMQALALGYSLGAGSANETQAQLSALKAEIENDITKLATSLNGVQGDVNDLTTETEEVEGEVDEISKIVEDMAKCMANNTFLNGGKCNTAYTHCDYTKLEAPDNGSIQGSALLPGSHMQFSCDAGYYLSGAEILTCKSDGKFSATPPTCKKCATNCISCTSTKCLEYDAIGSTQDKPAASCKKVLDANPNAPSGAYFIKAGGKTYKLYCDMDTDGGGWTLIAKAHQHKSWNQHLSRSDRNVLCLATNTLNCAGTLGTTSRLAIDVNRFNRFECAGNSYWGYRNCNNHADSWWSSGCGCMCWTTSFQSEKSKYTIGSGPDCGSPTCDGPSRSGRNWARRGLNGCGLGHGSYDKSGYWWVR